VGPDEDKPHIQGAEEEGARKGRREGGRGGGDARLASHHPFLPRLPSALARYATLFLHCPRDQGQDKAMHTLNREGGRASLASGGLCGAVHRRQATKHDHKHLKIQTTSSVACAILLHPCLWGLLLVFFFFVCMCVVCLVVVCVFLTVSLGVLKALSP